MQGKRAVFVRKPRQGPRARMPAPPLESRTLRRSAGENMIQSIRILAALSYLLPWAAPAQAQAEIYPSKPITLVVPYPPGGATDVIARAVAQRLTGSWGRP